MSGNLNNNSNNQKEINASVLVAEDEKEDDEAIAIEKSLFLSDIKDLRDLKNLKPHFIDALESWFFTIETIIDLFVGKTKNQFFCKHKRKW